MITEFTDMSSSLISSFEHLLVHIKQPASGYTRLYHPSYSPAFPATHLLSYLPLQSKLSLRRLSPTTKGWVDSAHPSVFSNLSVLFPLNVYSAEELLALHNTSPQCEHLTVTVSQYISVPRPGDAIPLPPFPRLQHLALTAPDHDPFYALLSFRLALQCAYVPLLAHLTINNLSVPGILALRWGSFTSFGDTGWTGGNVWQGLQKLDVKVVGWWQEERQERESYYNHKAEKENWRTCTRVLHDWLHSFAANGQLHAFRFEWVNMTSEGPNPFLLDEIVSSDGRKEWFSAPGIRWTDLKELRLGNVLVSLADVRRMKERMAGLKKLAVTPKCLDSELTAAGRTIVADGKTWIEVPVEGEWSEVVRRHAAATAELASTSARAAAIAAARRGTYRESVRPEDRASMVLPFMLDLSSEDETIS